MIVDSSELPSDAVITADICIIGAGAAGISIAQSFFSSSLTVALLEGGGMEYEEESQELYKGINKGFPYPLEGSRARYFGGTTNYWAGHVRPFTDNDFDGKPWIGVEGWPITKSDLDDYYQHAFNICMHGTGQDQWDIAYWFKKHGITSSLMDEDKFKVIIEQVMQRSQPSFVSFGTYFKNSLEKSDNVIVYLHSNVIELNTNESGNAIVSCSAYSKTDKQFSVKAKYFVVACGGIENARLLLVSNSTIKSGIGNQKDQVGRYFCDHPHANLGTFIMSGKPQAIEKLFRYNETPSGSKYVGEIELPKKIQKKHKLTNTFMRLLPKVPHSSDGTLSAWEILDNAKKGNVPDDILYHIGNVITEIDTLVERQYYKLSQKSPQRHYKIFMITEPVPTYESQISLIDAKDKFGKQQIGLNWQLNDIDKKTLLFASKTFATEMGRLGLGRVQLKTELENEWPNYLWEKHHHLCTTRMARNSSSGVVDKNCKVFSTKNLFIAGSSTFTTASTAPPTLTIVALALRLAEHIKGKLL